ncbi:hypothetical protein Goarm_014759 [Gossypium armourianum]|uniref:Uncharacterized protein n=1 Tax=Gossypium armourianum TaxID=34283 RepID=A0A7J9J9V2_9ROSI|nr:hypothetical protein [Gossypium armourianum]
MHIQRLSALKRWRKTKWRCRNSDFGVNIGSFWPS